MTTCDLVITMCQVPITVITSPTQQAYNINALPLQGR